MIIFPKHLLNRDKRSLFSLRIMIEIAMVKLSNLWIHIINSYLKKDGILFEQTLSIQMPSGEVFGVGYHRGNVENITYIFFHHAATFMRPYPSGSPSFQIQCIHSWYDLLYRSDSYGFCSAYLLHYSCHYPFHYHNK